MRSMPAWRQQRRFDFLDRASGGNFFCISIFRNTVQKEIFE